MSIATIKVANIRALVACYKFSCFHVWLFFMLFQCQSQLLGGPS